MAAKYSKKADPKMLFGELENAVPFSVATTEIMMTYLKLNYIYDDDRGIFGEHLTHTYVDSDKFVSVSKTRLNPTIHCTITQIDSGICEPYMQIVWRSSFEKTVIQRRYLTPFDVISEIGGFWDLITYGILFVYFVYNMRSYSLFVRSQLVEGFMDLDKMKSDKERKRSDDEVRRLKKVLTEIKIEEVKSGMNRYWFKKLFNTKPDLKKLVELNFKSKILVDILVKQPFFDTFTTKIIFDKKQAELKRKPMNEPKISKQKNLFEEVPNKIAGKEEECKRSKSLTPEKDRAKDSKHKVKEANQEKHGIDSHKIKIRKSMVSQKKGSEKEKPKFKRQNFKKKRKKDLEAPQIPLKKIKNVGKFSVGAQKKKKTGQQSQSTEEEEKKRSVSSSERNLGDDQLESSFRLIRIDEEEELQLEDHREKFKQRKISPQLKLHLRKNDPKRKVVVSSSQRLKKEPLNQEKAKEDQIHLEPHLKHSKRFGKDSLHPLHRSRKQLNQAHRV